MPTMYLKNGVVPQQLTVLFLGDSITDNGTYIAMMDAYFKWHHPDKRIRLLNLGVSSETAAGTSEPDHPFPRPCVHERLDAALAAAKPDWVVLGYGMNDGIYYPFAEDRFAAYRDGIMRAVRKVQEAGAKAIVVSPPPFDAAMIDRDKLQPEGLSAYAYNAPYRGYDDVLRKYAQWVAALGDSVDGSVDIHTPLAAALRQRRAGNPDYVSGDGIHPNALGHWVIARTLLGQLFNVWLDRQPEYVEGEDATGFFPLVMERHRLLSAAWKEHVGHSNPNKTDALPLAEAEARADAIDEQLRLLQAKHDTAQERVTDSDGYNKVEFYLHGRECILIRPKQAAPGNPWLWRAEFLTDFNQSDRELLGRGWHIAYIRLSNQYGCPGAVEAMRQFKLHVEADYGLAPRVSLFGFSRGGLYATNYAAAYPQDVASLYIDAPVLDIRSWPAGRGAGNGSPLCWEECKAVYGLTESAADSFTGNPLDKVDAIAAAGIPVILVAGDADAVVPYPENGELFAKRFSQRGGTIEVYVKPGVGHHPHSLENPTPIVSFVQRHA
ncbi:SGNH/GDSL hydrolase family protein [Paenibacillus cymbidii]|uniref:SGNH/GDSL hydrolase family protein n=1 Tax=Paenibacillus cymbidii TaxID=1639034 RepID=UPI001436C780|nr:GDSL-type esterase/lipase family protein [Paenibacillus cymbidii]